jgi:hypothetical protein
MLDACRNNPLAEHLKEAAGGAPSVIGRGLAREDSLDWDSVISFSTQPGNTASDGDGRNSPFTTALINHLALVDKNNDLGGILGRVRRDVVQATGRTQVPWDASSLRVPVYFDRSKQLELSEATLARGKVNRQNYAVQVTLQEAKSYANWLSPTTGKAYRLISEAEWERIMRAGTTSAYWWGSTMEARPTASPTIHGI